MILDRLGDSLWTLCILLFIDGATIAASSTVLMLYYGSRQEPWQIALFGGFASAAGGAVQLFFLQKILGGSLPWFQRFAPSRDKVEAALARYPSASFLMLAVARATPLPDWPLKLVAAVVKYPVLLFGLATFLGTVPYFFILALIGSKVHFPLWVLLAGLGVVLLGVVIDVVRRERQRRRETAAG